MFKPLLAASVLTISAFGWMQDWTQDRSPVVPLEGGKMIIEWAPGKEAVVRISAENEEDLERVRILRPDGQELVRLDAGPSGCLAGLELELRAPDLGQLLEDYVDGRYAIRASTSRGKRLQGQVDLSLDLPAAPRIVHPRFGQIVEGSNLRLMWLADSSAAGYEVQLEQGEDDGLRVRLPPQRSSFQVPRDFLAPGKPTTLEVIAIGANGNRTVSEVLFVTRP
jgi:hypothetical protein